jgi:uncharacterized protein YecT (DUF1311 family)
MAVMRSVVAIWVSVSVVGLAAQPVGARDVPCGNAAGPTEMAACLAERLARQVARVTSVERAILDGLGRVPPADDANPPTGVQTPRVRFEAAKTAWARYREAECEAQGSVYVQGTMEGVVRLVCESNLVLARLRELKHAYRDVLRGRRAGR